VKELRELVILLGHLECHACCEAEELGRLCFLLLLYIPMKFIVTTEF